MVFSVFSGDLCWGIAVGLSLHGDDHFLLTTWHNVNVWVIEALPAFPIKMCETMSREHSEGVFSSCVLAWNYGTMELWRVVLSAHHWLSCPTFWLFVGSVAIGCPPIDTSSHHPNLYHPLQVSAEWHAATGLQFSRFCRPIAGQSLESSTKDDLKS